MMMRMTIFISLFSFFFLSQCAVNPVTGRSELALISESQEIEMGKQYYGPTIQSFNGLYLDDETQTYVSDVGQNLARLSHRPHLDYEFKVVNSSEVNAFALPGGKICITRGLLTRMDNESQLAAVLGHEIGHVTAKHGVRAMSRQLLLGGFLSLGAMALDYKGVEGRDAIVTAGLVGLQAVLAKYSRDQESQSDELGLQYMTKANYNPTGAVQLFELFEKLQTREPNFVEKMFASHPQSTDRKEQAKRLIDLKYAQYLGANKSRATKAGFENLSGKLKKEAPHYEEYDKGAKALSENHPHLAINHLRKAIEGKPHEALFHADIGLAYEMIDDERLAEIHLKKAQVLYPSFFKPQFYLGYYYYKTKKYRLAAEAFARADKIVPGVAPLRLFWGESSEAIGNDRDAVELYRYVYQSDPQGNLGRRARGHLVRLGVLK
jgi:Zn-dependent protease with chaperone function